LGQYNGFVDYFTRLREGELDWHDGYEASHQAGYSTELTAERAIEFIRKRAGAEAPFFCYVPFNAPHAPFQAKPRDTHSYDNLEALPGNWNTEPPERAKNRRILGGMITSLDREIGHILKTIDEAGIRDNTLVLFFSDNGGVGGIGDNRPLRGAKGTVFEGGIRVAAAVRWPGVIPGNRVVNSPLAYIDVLPTIMRIVGVESHGGKPLDGLDVFDVLTGEKKVLLRDIYCYTGPQGEDFEQITYMTPEWKLIVRGRNVLDSEADDSSRVKLLFKIEQDPGEQHNLAGTYPKVVARMFDKVTTFRALQPPDAVAPYQQGRKVFRAPKEWSFPDR
jgi:arylsulfatase B